MSKPDDNPAERASLVDKRRGHPTSVPKGLQGKVFQFAGDDAHPAGEVTITARRDHGQVTVTPVGGGEPFTVKRDLLQGDDEGDGEE